MYVTDDDRAEQDAWISSREDEHHDNRYEDGVPFYTGTVADYESEWAEHMRRVDELIARVTPEPVYEF